MTSKRHKVLIIMDPPETVHPDKDTTFALGEKAAELGLEVFYARVEDVFIEDGIPQVGSRACQFRRNIAEPIVFIGPKTVQAVDDFDFTLMRKDPPYDMNYIFVTHLLGFAKKSRVLNRPSGLREAPEKLSPFRFPGIFPPTLISRKINDIIHFAKSHPFIILKPLDGNGGRGVVKTSATDTNLNSLAELLTKQETDYIIAQEYIPDITTGDKRVILLDGETLGGILRIPPAGENRANLHIGGQAAKLSLTKRDFELCEIIGPFLRDEGLYLTGIDIIGNYIIEINVTSPTGIQEVRFFDGTDIAEKFWKKLI